MTMARRTFTPFYGSNAVTISIRDGEITGEFPRRALKLVLEWCRLHEEELLENWELARLRKSLKRIAPLE